MGMVERKPISRRAVLQGTSVSFGLAATSSLFGSVKAQNRYGSEVITVTGTKDDPVSYSQIHNARKQTERQISNSSMKRMRSYGLPKVDVRSDQYVKSYSQKICSDGLPLSHVEYGYTTNEEVDANDENLEAQVSKFEETKTVDGYSTAFDIGDKWQNHGIMTMSAKKDYNKIKSESFMATYTGEGIEDDRDVIAAGGTHIANPACNRSDGLERTDIFKVKSDYTKGSYYDVRSPGITGTDPSGTIEERVTNVNYSISGTSDGAAEASISYSYSQPKIHMEELTDSSGHHNVASWKWDSTADSKDIRLEFNTASRCWYDDIPSCRVPNHPTDTVIGGTKLWGRFDQFWAVETDITSEIKHQIIQC